MRSPYRQYRVGIPLVRYVWSKTCQCTWSSLRVTVRSDKMNQKSAGVSMTATPVFATISTDASSSRKLAFGLCVRSVKASIAHWSIRVDRSCLLPIRLVISAFRSSYVCGFIRYHLLEHGDGALQSEDLCLVVAGSSLDLGLAIRQLL